MEESGPPSLQRGHSRAEAEVIAHKRDQTIPRPVVTPYLPNATWQAALSSWASSALRGVPPLRVPRLQSAL